MRIWQVMYTKELLSYGTDCALIANSVGLPTSAVQSIKDGAVLPDKLVLQYEKDRNRCPKCGRLTKTHCFTCFQKEQPAGTLVEVIERPNTHNGYMLNVHLYNRRGKEL